MEQEQRRLSSYQIEKADGRGQAPISNCETSGLPSSKNRKTNVQARKYVVDNSKPRTDLEYDPLSNFSAALRSYSSPGKEHKVKHREAKSSICVRFNQEKPSSHQAQMSPSPSPDPPQDCVLLIDISLSPEKPGGPSQKSIAVKSSQVQKRETREAKTEAAPLHSAPLSELVDVSPSSKDNVNKVCDRCAAESNQDSPTCNDSKDSEVDLTGYLKAFEIECQSNRLNFAKTAEKASKNVPIKSDQRGHSSHLESTDGAEKISSLQPPNNSHLYKPLAANCPPTRRSTKQPAQDEVPSCSESSAVQNGQKTLSRTQGKLQRRSVNPQQAEEPHVGGPGSSQSVSSSVNSSSRAESSKSIEAESEAVIIVDSSCDEDEEDNGEEMELSDSDPMEECYRIFMEANRDENRTEEHPGVSVSTRWKQFHQQSRCVHSNKINVLGWS